MKIRQSILLVLSLGLILALAACGSSSHSGSGGGGGGGNPPPPVPALGAGNYVFSVQGTDSTGFSYSVAGVFTVDSNGKITGGEQDFADVQFILAQDTFNPATSSATLAADGNLQIILDTQDLSLGPNGNGIETFNGTLTCTCKAQITEFDGFATGNGTLDLQSSTATPSGGYAFGVAGIDINGNPVAVGGILNVDTDNGDGSATISGTGSIFDANDDFTPFPAEALNASAVSAPDSMGRVTITLNPAADFSPIVFEGYIVDSTRIRLVESADSFGLATGGSALGQGTAGGFTTIAGNSYAVGFTGFDANFVEQVAGVFTAGGSGASGPVTGNISYNDLVNTSSGSQLLAGTYTLDSTGRVTMTGVSDGILTPFDLQLYLTGDGHAIAISMDNTDVLAGLGFAQTPPFDATTVAGTYVMNAGGADQNLLGPFSAVGPLTADGSSTLTPPSGSGVDLNWLDFTDGFATFAGLAVSGGFTAPDSSGTFGGTITGIDLTNGGNNPDAFTYYVGDTDPASGNVNTVVMIETDSNQLTLGLLSLELE